MLSPEMNSNLQRFCSSWGWFLLLGIGLIALGTIALGSVVLSTFVTVMFFGGFLIAAGIFKLLSVFGIKEWRSLFLQVLIGILSITVGWMLIANPAISVLTLTLILATYFIAAGLFKIVTALMVNYEHWGWLLFNGIITLILGILILSQWPSSALWVIGMFIAIDLIFDGWYFVILSLTIRKSCRINKHKEQTIPENYTR